VDRGVKAIRALLVSLSILQRFFPLLQQLFTACICAKSMISKKITATLKITIAVIRTSIIVESVILNSLHYD